VDYIEVAQDRVQWQAVMNMTKKPDFHKRLILPNRLGDCQFFEKDCCIELVD
jgi:hypothetical protein